MPSHTDVNYIKSGYCVKQGGVVRKLHFCLSISRGTFVNESCVVVTFKTKFVIYGLPPANP
jgi:hypothetical protein